ncbi:hypothetical protein B0T17DRAFT_511732 [Bombardia bombarda]|uniref:Uncharacterized protein n=1 Tax=Bombardia bombarda TaxID=252184 RepID=A0AA39TZD2_9PEZI|nr:hypothetical protein B0T17DRAFT_511732 [Bombardia bombarda]
MIDEQEWKGVGLESSRRARGDMHVTGPVTTRHSSEAGRIAHSNIPNFLSQAVVGMCVGCRLYPSSCTPAAIFATKSNLVQSIVDVHSGSQEYYATNSAADLVQDAKLDHVSRAPKSEQCGAVLMAKMFTGLLCTRQVPVMGILLSSVKQCVARSELMKDCLRAGNTLTDDKKVDLDVIPALDVY